MSSLEKQNNKFTRFLALDAFRGFTLAAMILVNTPGSWGNIYSPLKHARWHGATVTDFIFPFFLFIVGASIYFAMGKVVEHSYLKQCLKVGKRAVLIFFIGVGLNWFPFEQNIENLRIMGVLQRIALAYLGATLIVIFSQGRYLTTITVAILLFYWGILFFFGGNEPYSTVGNVASVVDAFVLSEQHMSTNFALSRGFSIAFEPEGILSTLPAVASVLIGYIALVKLSKFNEYQHAIPALLTYGTIVIVCGLLLNAVLPINKPLWTSSYVLLTSGTALMCLAFWIWLTNFNYSKKLMKPFVIYGMNPLFIYALSWLWVRTISHFVSIEAADGSVSNLYHAMYRFFLAFSTPVNASLLFAMSHVFIFYVVSFVLFKKKIIIKI